jgi:hypothetical protein
LDSLSRSGENEADTSVSEVRKLPLGELDLFDLLPTEAHIRSTVYSFAFPCSAQERSILKEFPHYGGREPKIHGDVELGDCLIVYETEASQKRVAEYYMKQLKAHGWKAEKSVSESGEQAEGSKKKPKKTFPSISIEAKRGEFYYTVDFESHEILDNPSAGAHVVVGVGKN